MRNWVEKLAKAIEKEGKIDIHSWKLNDWSINVYDLTDGSKRCALSDGDQGMCIKLYDDEYDILQKARETCKRKSEDHFIELINNFE